MTTPNPSPSVELEHLDAWWRAANYLTVGQIYLQENVLLREPLRPEHIKPRLLGHWGTSPGLSFVYAHLNRAIRERDLDVIFLAGPGHGGPAVVASTWLEGTYSEVYPAIGRDAAGMRALFRQFSTPGGIPSHVSPPTPGSIHEGGELGYVLSHAFGAAFDNPQLLVAAVVGDGEAETGPLAGSWKGIRFLNAARDGAVLPILHLNGYKIAGPTVLGRSSDEDVAAFLSGHGYAPRFVVGDDPMAMHVAFAAVLDDCLDSIADIQIAARTDPASVGACPRWPVIVLRSPKGWTGPDVVDGVQIAGTFRAHQVPLAGVRENPEHLKLLEAWLQSYRPHELFDSNGLLAPALAQLAPAGQRRMSANPHANPTPSPLALPPVAPHALACTRGTELHESTRQLGGWLRDLYRDNPTSFRLFCPDETNSNRLGAIFEREQRCMIAVPRAGDDHIAPSGRVMEVLSEHDCEGWLEGYVLTGRHGLFATYEAFALIVASMVSQHAKWLEACGELAWRHRIPSLNVLLTSTCWRNDHNGFSHQGPGFMDTVLSKKGAVQRIYLPADANTLLVVARHAFAGTSRVNLIVIDKQPELQWLSLDEAEAHVARGASCWEWASSEDGRPDLVMACAGDTATLETMAAVDWLARNAPALRVRVVNVVDFMALSAEHPHGMDRARFIALFTEDLPVVFAFHGYPGAVHQVVHGRPRAERFHVRGYREEGTTTTPFDMVVLNGMSRFHLAKLALERAGAGVRDVAGLVARLDGELATHHAYVREHFEDQPAIRDWTWPGARA